MRFVLFIHFRLLKLDDNMLALFIEIFIKA